MRLRVLAIVAPLLGALFFLQSRLEASKEQHLERASQNLSDLKASSLLPTYIGSLFLGSFRAVAIDILWIQMQRMREQEHRYFETVEYMELITKLQPRNPEAWAFMGWDASGNIANQFRTEDDEEELRIRRATEPKSEQVKNRILRLEKNILEKDQKYRAWVKRGFLTLAEGSRHMPEDPYLQCDIGQTLWTKSAWGPGVLDRQFLQAVEDDDDLQRVLGEGLPPARRTAYELSEIWFAKGQATLERLIKAGRFRVYRTLAETMSRRDDEERRHHTTQMGRNIDLASCTGAIHQVRYLDGILKWNRARNADPATARELLLKASESFAKAAEQARLYRRLYSSILPELRAMHDSRADLCEGLSKLCADQADLPHPIADAEKAKLLARLELIWWSPVDRDAPPEKQVPPTDDRYVVDYMGWLKQSLGGDGYEYNDFRYALDRGNQLFKDARADATIGPEPTDVDWYHFYAAPPVKKGHEGHTHEEPEPAAGAMESRFRIKRVGDVPLTVTAFGYIKGRLATALNFDVTGDTAQDFDVPSDVEGWVFLM
ncbi:MAG TPA: hypothetical protein VJU16_05195, partial [Planctomycetota bacterium]|nr:hypothetical protein [Planctomycetota bacterium]